MNRFDRCTRRRLPALFLAVVCATPIALLAQELVVTTGTQVGGFPQFAPVVIFPDVSGAPVDPPRNYVISLDSPELSTHGLALISANRALTTQLAAGAINLIDTSTATLIDNFRLPDPALNVHYDGLGTVAINPARTHVLALTGLNTLWVIPAPFDHTAAVTMVALPSGAGTGQTRAIAFDQATGRAYLALQIGIAVLDPPYTSIAFTIPSSNGVGSITGAIALSPDSATLVATRGLNSSGYAADVRIFHAPFSVASVPQVLTIPVAGASLDGLTFTPDGNKVLVVESITQTAPMLPRVYAISSPYSSASSVDTLSFDTGGTHAGFEDIDISADGQLAALSGGSGGNNEPLILLRAPFTAAGFSFVKYDIPAIWAPFDQPGRGAGTARFWSAAILPAPDVQVWVDRSAQGSENAGNQGGVRINEGNSGTSDALIPVNLSGPSTETVTVHYATSEYAPLSSGAATAADNDYIPASGTLTFAPGETQKNIVVKVVGDTKYELDEGLIVTISNPVNATIVGSTPGFADTATVVILNDDAVIPFAISTTALPPGVTGVPYSFQLTGQGLAPLKWSFFGPPGLSVDPVTGIISGIPIFPGTTSAEIQLTEGINYFTGTKFLDLTVTGAAIPYAALSPNPLAFGNVAVGGTSTVKQTTIDNNGGADLVLGSPIVSIPPGSEFALATGTGACTPGQSIAETFHCNLYFTFSPQATGTRTLDLPLVTNAPAATLTLTGVGTGGGVPPVAAISRKVHGTAGTFDLPLSPTPTNPTTEPRIGPNHTIVIPFASAATAATVTVTEGVATASAATFSGNEVIVGLTGVSNRQYVTIQLTNVSFVGGGAGSGSVRIGFLLADVNQNRAVTVSDEVLVNAQIAHVVTSANFLKDVNANGLLSVSDLLITNNNVTKVLPAP